MRKDKKIIDDYLEEYRNNGIVFNDIDLCEIQNCIYEHRKTAFKIPDFYFIIRCVQNRKKLLILQLENLLQGILISNIPL